MEILWFEGTALYRHVSRQRWDGQIFAGIPEVEDLLVFEPREFISVGDKVTVLGWERSQVRLGGKVFESEWAHLFTIRRRAHPDDARRRVSP